MAKKATTKKTSKAIGQCDGVAVSTGGKEWGIHAQMVKALVACGVSKRLAIDAAVDVIRVGIWIEKGYLDQALVNIKKLRVQAALEKGIQKNVSRPPVRKFVDAGKDYVKRDWTPRKPPHLRQSISEDYLQKMTQHAVDNGITAADLSRIIRRDIGVPISSRVLLQRMHGLKPTPETTQRRETAALRRYLQA